jgi:AcrR family transcriptional regulator
MKTRALSPSRPKKRTPKPYHHGDLRESLLRAAEQVLVERGAHGITLRDVAKVAGVSHAAPYHHFASLHDLLAAVAEHGFVRLSEVLERVSIQPDTRERLLMISESYVSYARAHPARFRLMFGPLMERKNEYPALTNAAGHAFALLLSAATAHDPSNGAELALCGWSLVHGLSKLMIDGVLSGLPVAIADPESLARLFALRLLGPVTSAR